MGRRRVNADPIEPLPRGLQKHRRQYRARISAGHPWIKFGEDYPEALRAFAAWRRARGIANDVAWLLDKFAGEICVARVAAGTMKPRTASDYLRDTVVLKKGLGKIPYASLAAPHVVAFRDSRVKRAPAHVRNELACLSAAYAWALEAGLVSRNVVKDVSRPPKQVRDRLISDAEYVAVYDQAGTSTRLAMTLAIRTLASPADVLRIGPRNVIRYDDGRRTLRFKRGKTGVAVEVEIVTDLEAALTPFLEAPTLHPSFVRQERHGKGFGKPYTVDGIGAMFRRYCAKAQVTDFGLRDLRAKGATDMYRGGVDIRHIQRLLGHKSVQTTEIYLKSLLAEIVRPNERPIIGLVKS
jgi:integrase